MHMQLGLSHLLSDTRVSSTAGLVVTLNWLTLLCASIGARAASVLFNDNQVTETEKEKSAAPLCSV